MIDHPAGPIAADYEGSVRVETRQIGTAGVAGRPSTLRCNWSAALNLERTAKVGETLHSRRVMTSEDVASGSTPGWCKNSDKAIRPAGRGEARFVPQRDARAGRSGPARLSLPRPKALSALAAKADHKA